MHHSKILKHNSTRVRCTKFIESYTLFNKFGASVAVHVPQIKMYASYELAQIYTTVIAMGGPLPLNPAQFFEKWQEWNKS